MITEKSCGAVVFTTENDRIQYLIICSKEGICGFPKGHIEKAESETDTALREVLEETGLHITLIPGFKTEDIHSFIRSGESRRKHIIYFLGEYSHQAPKAQQSELSGIHLMDYDCAMAAFQFESSKRILSEAHQFLLSLPQYQCFRKPIKRGECTP